MLKSVNSSLSNVHTPIVKSYLFVYRSPADAFESVDCCDPSSNEVPSGPVVMTDVTVPLDVEVTLIADVPVRKIQISNLCSMLINMRLLTGSSRRYSAVVRSFRSKIRAVATRCRHRSRMRIRSCARRRHRTSFVIQWRRCSRRMGSAVWSEIRRRYRRRLISYVIRRRWWGAHRTRGWPHTPHSHTSGSRRCHSRTTSANVDLRRSRTRRHTWLYTVKPHFMLKTTNSINEIRL